MRWCDRRFVAAAVVCVGCTPEFSVQSGPKVPPAEPPGDEVDDLGDPPTWQDCLTGWRGVYTNLTVDDPYVDPRPRDPEAPTDPGELPWWDQADFEKFDPSLDFGSNWWPVDDGLAEDPKYFAAYWHAWLRAWSDTNLTLSIGSSDDIWVSLGDEIIASEPGIHDLVRQPYTVSLDAGVYPIEVRYAHRGSETSGLSLRVLEGDVSVCYPEFEVP